MEEFYNVLEELCERVKDGAIVLVEGRKDVKALNDLGIDGRIIPISSLPRAKVAEMVEGDVIILTDWDEKGERLKRELFNVLLSRGIVADVTIRRKLFSVVDVTEVEDLVKFKLRTHPRPL